MRSYFERAWGTFQFPSEQLMVSRYRARCYRHGQGFTSVDIEAQSEAAACSRLQQDGWHVLGIESGRMLRKAARFSVDGFARELLTLLEAGMTLSEAIDVLTRQNALRGSGDVLAEVSRLIGEGKSFSSALEYRKDVFPVLFIASVRSSEASGIVPDALRRYLGYRQQIDKIRNRFIAAATYPLVLMTISGALIVFLLGFVVPRFSRIYANLGESMPLASRVMIRWSEILEFHGASLGVAALCAIGIMFFVLSRPAVRAGFVHWAWRLPGIGERMRIYDLARFTRTLAMLQSGGIPFVPAMTMTTQLIHQPALRGSVESARRLIAEGKSVADVFAQTGLATEVGIRLLGVAERGGELAPMLGRVADLYDQMLERDIEWFSRLLEPALMLVVGVVIGAVILLMYMPIFELANLAR